MALILNIPKPAAVTPASTAQPASPTTPKLNLQITQPPQIKQSVASEVTSTNSNNNNQSTQEDNNGGNSNTNTSNNNIQSQTSANQQGQGQRSVVRETPSGANQAISERLESMAAALKLANPDITNDLHFIHRAILEDPSQVTMLTEEQKIIFFAGLKQKTGAEIIATTAKTKQASSKKLATLSVDDLL